MLITKIKRRVLIKIFFLWNQRFINFLNCSKRDGKCCKFDIFYRHYLQDCNQFSTYLTSLKGVFSLHNYLNSIFGTFVPMLAIYSSFSAILDSRNDNENMLQYFLKAFGFVLYGSAGFYEFLHICLLSQKLLDTKENIKKCLREEIINVDGLIQYNDRDVVKMQN